MGDLIFGVLPFVPAPLTRLDIGAHLSRGFVRACGAHFTHGCIPTPLKRLYIPLVFWMMQKSAVGTTENSRGWSEAASVPPKREARRRTAASETHGGGPPNTQAALAAQE